MESAYFSCMKSASIQELKLEISNLPASQLAAICIRLAKFKKENKELLTYLLFESFDEQAYIENIKAEVAEEFKAINKSNIYFAKKSLRRILRTLSKYIRYTGSPETEATVLLFFCRLLSQSGIPVKNNQVLKNMYQSQLKKIAKAVAGMHEDLQYEYNRELQQLEAFF